MTLCAAAGGIRKRRSPRRCRYLRKRYYLAPDGPLGQKGYSLLLSVRINGARESVGLRSELACDQDFVKLVTNHVPAGRSIRSLRPPLVPAMELRISVSDCRFRRL